MPYSERAYFTTDACHHVAAWQDQGWRIARRSRASDRRRQDLEHRHALEVLAL